MAAMNSASEEAVSFPLIERDTGQSGDIWSHLLRITIILTSLGLLFLSIRQNLFALILDSARQHRWFYWIAKPSALWAIMGTSMLCIRTFLWLRYRSMPSATFENAPAMTVIIPAYNEGSMVAKSIDSVAAARYPAERLEILVVDDGSKDDTWEHIEAAAARHPGLVKTIRFDRNQGKRAALEKGFREGRGEVMVTIDSDSVIEADTLLAIAGPFADPKVGAVAGKVVVYNKDEGFIPKMLQVRFILSFDFLRAAQSANGIVFCCPGALSAYRASAVRKVLKDWIEQKFFGVTCTYGEDRALTNFILAQGLKTVYQRSAAVQTVVPNTYSKLCKMYVRWDRSYIREEFHFARIFRNQPLRPALFAFVDAMLTNFRYPVGWAAMVLLVLMVVHSPITLLRVTLAIGVMAGLNTLYYLQSERSWRYVYGVFYAYYAFALLFWIFPYALVTVRARSWMTR